MAILAATARLLRMEAQRLQRILFIGVPIIGGMLSQSLLNLIDAAMVGRLGDTAMAGVGVGGYANFIVVALVMGLATGVQALVARRAGSGIGNPREPLIAGLWLSLGVGALFTLLFISLSSHLIPFFTKDAQVIEIAVEYFDWRTIGLVAIAANFVFRGYWSGIGQARIYLISLLYMHVVNVVVSYFLIFGIGSWQGFGAVGSGIGTTIAMFFGTAIYLWATFRRHNDDSIPFIPTRKTLRQVLKLSLPNSAQQTLFALGTSVLFWIIGQVGTAEQAIGYVLINLSLLLILPAVGLGLASTTLVGQALGRGDHQDAYRWGWEAVRVAVFLMALLGLPLWLFPEYVLRLFTHEQHLIELGLWPLRISGINIVFEVTAMVLTQSLLGAGASRQVMRISFLTQWCLLLPLAYWIGPVAGFGLLGIWLIQGGQRITLSLVYALIWRARNWARIVI